MFELQSRYAISVRVGAFFLGIMALLAIGLFMVRGKTGLFEPKYTMQILFYNAKGINLGAPVKLAGVPVGYVKSIKFAPQTDDYHLIVTVGIKKSVQSRIRSDSTAYLESSGIIGDKYIEVSMGSIEKPIIKAGGSIWGKQ